MLVHGVLNSRTNMDCAELQRYVCQQDDATTPCPTPPEPVVTQVATTGPVYTEACFQCSCYRFYEQRLAGLEAQAACPSGWTLAVPRYVNETATLVSYDEQLDQYPRHS